MSGAQLRSVEAQLQQARADHDLASGVVEARQKDERSTECRARLLVMLRGAPAAERAEAALALRAQEDARAVPAAPAEM